MKNKKELTEPVVFNFSKFYHVVFINSFLLDLCDCHTVTVSYWATIILQYYPSVLLNHYEILLLLHKMTIWH